MELIIGCRLLKERSNNSTVRGSGSGSIAVGKRREFGSVLFSPLAATTYSVNESNFTFRMLD